MTTRAPQFLVLLLSLGSMCFTACSSIPASKSVRKGWLESLEEQPQKRSSVSERNQDSVLGRARTARWARVASSVQLSWPLKSVHVTSEFGVRNGEPHEGIDFRALSGTPVYASHDGTVLYSGSRIGGYGNLIVLKHPSGISTVYAHNSRLFVRKGHQVRRGQRIALSGTTGKSTGPHLHFEVRAGLKAVDPLRFMGTSISLGDRNSRKRGTRSALAASTSLR